MNTVHIARHQKKEWPSHARRRSRKGTGEYCIQQFVTTSSMFKLTDHCEHICFLIGANEGCKKRRGTLKGLSAAIKENKEWLPETKNKIFIKAGRPHTA